MIRKLFKIKKTAKFLCSFSVIHTVFHRIHIPINTIKDSNLSCILQLKKFNRKYFPNDTNNSLLSWNALTKEQFFFLNKSINEIEHRLGFSHEKAKISMKINFKFIIKC
jgi:hypothetical protein